MRVPREKLLSRVVDELMAKRPGHPLRVAVDGITAAGKTTFARELTAAVVQRGRPATQLSMDGYHHVRAHRHRQGRESAAGYYEDAYDFAAFARLVLEPLSARQKHRYVPSIIDLASDTVEQAEPIELTADALLIVDGSFLQRELRAFWDEVIWLDTDFELARARGARRDASALGGLEAAQRIYTARYHAAQRRYLEEVRPRERATIVISHDDPSAPVLRRIGGDETSIVSLFSYGTLQQGEVQLANFGRRLKGAADRLPGYRTEWTTIVDPEVIAESGTDRHPIVVPGDSTDVVPGTVFELSTVELAAADEYEVEEYARTLVTLESGCRAWVYISQPGAP